VSKNLTPGQGQQYGQCLAKQLGRNDLPIKVYVMKHIIPTEVSDIALDMSSNDALETFTVTFAVNEWYCSKTT